MRKSVFARHFLDGGTIVLSNGTNTFVFDKSLTKGPTYGKWLTNWPEKGGVVVEKGMPEYAVLSEMIHQYNTDNISVSHNQAVPVLSEYPYVERKIRQERYRDGGSIFLTDGTYSFVQDNAIGKSPTKGKWLTGWPKQGGKLVEEGTPEFDVLAEMIRLNNLQNTGPYQKLTPL